MFLFNPLPSIYPPFLVSGSYPPLLPFTASHGKSNRRTLAGRGRGGKRPQLSPTPQKPFFKTQHLSWIVLKITLRVEKLSMNNNGVLNKAGAAHPIPPFTSFVDLGCFPPPSLALPSSLVFLLQSVFVFNSKKEVISNWLKNCKKIWYYLILKQGKPFLCYNSKSFGRGIYDYLKATNSWSAPI